MSTFQFKSNKVLFKANKITFCPTDCTCNHGVDPPPPPPPPNCPDCVSVVKCPPLQCTPSKVRVAFAGATFPAYVNCGTGSVVLAGTLNGMTLDLPQDPQEPCRWLIDNPASSLTLTAYSAAAGGGSIVATTTRLRIGVQRVDDGIVVFATMVFNPYTEFVLIVANLLATEFPSGSTAIPATTFSTTCQQWNYGGGRIGNGGTATITACPPTAAPACTCVDGSQPLCLRATGLSVKDTCSLFTPYTGDVTTDASPTALLMTKTGVCTWSTGVQPASGMQKLTFGIVYNATGEQGCGYYGTLTGDTATAGLYFKAAGTGPAGVYRQYYSFCTGTPAAILVANFPCPLVLQDCADDSLWPTAVTATIVDHDYAGTTMDITGTYTVPLGGSSFGYDNVYSYDLPGPFTNPATGGGVYITLYIFCEGTRWLSVILYNETAGSVTFDRFTADQHSPGPKLGAYTYLDTTDTAGQQDGCNGPCTAKYPNLALTLS
jgi:hypothetical protein